jgi:hypothetical protein
MSHGSSRENKLQVKQRKPRRMKTVQEAIEYIERSIATFANDPPDSATQEAYLNALEDTRDALQQAADGRPWPRFSHMRYRA